MKQKFTDILEIRIGEHKKTLKSAQQCRRFVTATQYLKQKIMQILIKKYAYSSGARVKEWSEYPSPQ